MEKMSYCEKLVEELGAWKGKADHIVRELDELSSGDKGKMLPEIFELHMFVEELYDRIDRLTSCSGWSSPLSSVPISGNNNSGAMTSGRKSANMSKSRSASKT